MCERGNLKPDDKREAQVSRACERESSEAGTRDGLTSKSEECAVMASERRSQPGAVNESQPQGKSSDELYGKTCVISRQEVELAWQRVKAKGGSGGVDGESIKSFEEKLDENLYKIWNRMSSGSYHPKAVLRVEIPKVDGSKRPLGIPTIQDRVAQAVVRARLEPSVEKLFHKDSYGYRPNKSAPQAVGTCRERCWKYDWVLDVDIQKFFDTIDHDLVMKAVDKHCKESWMKLYIKRWLRALVQHKDGRVEEMLRGTPQGGVISPLLANLYLHYAFDLWVERSYPGVKFERYADDIIIHCESEEQSKAIQQSLAARLQECGLTLHPEKTKVVYCKDESRKEEYPETRFTFLGYTFQPRSAQNQKTKRVFTRFLPAVATKAEKRFRDSIKENKTLKMVHLSLDEIAKQLNPKIRGWYRYFSHFYKSALSKMSDWLDMAIVRWVRNKFKLNWTKAHQVLTRIRAQQPSRFVHWHL